MRKYEKYHPIASVASTFFSQMLLFLLYFLSFSSSSSPKSAFIFARSFCSLFICLKRPLYQIHGIGTLFETIAFAIFSRISIEKLCELQRQQQQELNNDQFNKKNIPKGKLRNFLFLQQTYYESGMEKSSSMNWDITQYIHTVPS